MILWTMLVHGFGSILGRFAAVLVFFASCPVSFWSSSDKFLEILVFYWVTAIILRFFLRFWRCTHLLVLTFAALCCIISS